MYKKYHCHVFVTSDVLHLSIHMGYGYQLYGLQEVRAKTSNIPLFLQQLFLCGNSLIFVNILNVSYQKILQARKLWEIHPFFPSHRRTISININDVNFMKSCSMQKFSKYRFNNNCCHQAIAGEDLKKKSGSRGFSKSILIFVSFDCQREL